VSGNPIRDSAKVAPCLLRVPQVCRSRYDTTVHAHIRAAGAGGTSLKPNDLIACRACFECHEWLDERAGTGLWHDIRDTIILHGLIRTLDALWREGLITLDMIKEALRRGR